MKKAIFNTIIIIAITLNAREVPFTKGNVSKMESQNNFKTSEVKVLLDSAWNYDWNPTLNRYDSLFTIIDFWNEKTGEPLGGQSYRAHKGMLFNDLKVEASKTTNGLIKTYIQTISNWDSLARSWINNQQTVFIQNLQNGIDTSITYVWKEAEWMPTIKREEHFNHNIDSGSVKEYIWIEKKNRWEGNHWRIHNRNSQRKELLSCSYDWDTLSNSWRGDYKYEFSYNNMGQQLTKTEYLWSQASNDWYVSKKTFTYFDDMLKNSIDSIYIFNNNTWVIEIGKKREYLYDEEQRIIFLKVHDWDRNGSTELGYTDTYSYDEFERISTIRETTYSKHENLDTKDGLNLLHASYRWDASKKIWVGERKYETEYDELGNELLYKRSEWNSLLGDWFITDLDKSFYSLQEISGIDEEHYLNDSFVYPNPSHDIAIFNFGKNVNYRLFDSHGILLKQGFGKSLDVHEFIDGIYSLELITEGRRVIQKLIKN